MPKYELPTDRTFITPDYMRKRYGKYDPNVFRRWRERGLVEKVRNGVYRNRSIEMKGDLDRFVNANNVLSPSYVTGYSAFGYYGLIPEYVFNVTSVTTKKTDSFTFRKARYSYQHIKPALYFGYRTYEWRGSSYQIASLEKALLDFAYLEPLFSDFDWLEEMRFDEDVLRDDVDWLQAYIYAKQMNSETVLNRIGNLLNVYDL